MAILLRTSAIEVGIEIRLRDYDDDTVSLPIDLSVVQSIE